MSEKPLQTYQTKGVRGKSGPPEFGLHWIFARRGRLKFFNDRIELGNWVIRYNEVSSAIIWRARTQILEIKTVNEEYQFGLNPWAKISPELPIEIATEAVRMRHTASSIMFRFIAIAIIGVLIWRAFA